MKKLLAIIAILGAGMFVLAACNSEPEAVEPRAVYEIARLYIDGESVNIAETAYANSRLTFIGEESGGNVIIRLGEAELQASINPSREHPSFEQGYWHHHLYAGATAAGSPRINFVSAFPELGIDDNPEATDNTQSAYQRGNLHYVIDMGEFRLRFTIDEAVHDLFFTIQ